MTHRVWTAPPRYSGRHPFFQMALRYAIPIALRRCEAGWTTVRTSVVRKMRFCGETVSCNFVHVHTPTLSTKAHGCVVQGPAPVKTIGQEKFHDIFNTDASRNAPQIVKAEKERHCIRADLFTAPQCLTNRHKKTLTRLLQQRRATTSARLNSSKCPTTHSPPFSSN